MSEMKATKKLVGIVMCAAALVVAVSPVSANLLTNPGFETGDLTGWLALNTSGNANITVESPDNGPSAAGTHNAFLNNQVTTPSNARFCRSATSFFRPGDTSWGIKGAADTAFSCGCNSGGWQGVGSYYGGINPSCSVCACWGGGWSGSVTNGQQKGGLNHNQTHFWVR